MCANGVCNNCFWPEFDSVTKAVRSTCVSSKWALAARLLGVVGLPCVVFMAFDYGCQKRRTANCLHKATVYHNTVEHTPEYQTECERLRHIFDSYRPMPSIQQEKAEARMTLTLGRSYFRGASLYDHHQQEILEKVRDLRLMCDKSFPALNEAVSTLVIDAREYCMAQADYVIFTDFDRPVLVIETGRAGHPDSLHKTMRVDINAFGRARRRDKLIMTGLLVVSAAAFFAAIL